MRVWCRPQDDWLSVYTRSTERTKALDAVRDKYGLLAVYLFGSRADDGLRTLRGEAVEPEGSDLDIGIVSSRAGGRAPAGTEPLRGHRL